MLTIFRRFIVWARHPKTRSPTPAETHSYCSESEFCFFNHSATLPFDQRHECHNNGLSHEEKTDNR